jgi:hypothetical protein
MEGTVGYVSILDCVNNLCFSHRGLPFFIKQKNNQPNYNYSSASSKWLWANKEGTCDTGEFKAMLTKGHGASLDHHSRLHF